MQPSGLPRARPPAEAHRGWGADLTAPPCRQAGGRAAQGAQGGLAPRGKAQKFTPVPLLLNGPLKFWFIRQALEPQTGGCPRTKEVADP